MKTECDAAYPSLHFLFDGHWIETRPEAYLWEEEDGETCTFLIMPVTSPTNMLGMPMFIDYYTVFDPTKTTIGWAPHKDSLKSPLVSGSLPPKDQYLEVRSLDEVMGLEELHITSFIFSWVLTLTLTFAGYYFWNSCIRPHWKNILGNISYLIVLIMLTMSTLLISIFVAQPFLY